MLVYGCQTEFGLVMEWLRLYTLLWHLQMGNGKLRMANDKWFEQPFSPTVQRKLMVNGRWTCDDMGLGSANGQGVRSSQGSGRWDRNWQETLGTECTT